MPYLITFFFFFQRIMALTFRKASNHDPLFDNAMHVLSLHRRNIYRGNFACIPEHQRTGNVVSDFIKAFLYNHIVIMSVVSDLQYFHFCFVVVFKSRDDATKK